VVAVTAQFHPSYVKGTNPGTDQFKPKGINMTEIESNDAVEFAPEEIIDPIEVIYTGTCESLSGKSTITFDLGKHTEDETLYMRIACNSSSGMFNDQWISASVLQDIFVGSTDLNSRNFQAAYGSTSVNTPGFCMAALKQLGLIEVDPQNARIHRHKARTVFAQVVKDLIAAPKDQETKPVRKKGRPV
jgi:hypothetical protein